MVMAFPTLFDTKRAQLYQQLAQYNAGLPLIQAGLQINPVQFSDPPPPQDDPAAQHPFRTLANQALQGWKGFGTSLLGALPTSTPEEDAARAQENVTPLLLPQQPDPSAGLGGWGKPQATVPPKGATAAPQTPTQLAAPTPLPIVPQLPPLVTPEVHQPQPAQAPVQAPATAAAAVPAAGGPNLDEATRFLLGRTDKDPSHIEGMKPELRQRLTSLFESAPPAFRDDLGIFSGYRSVERQGELYRASHGSGMVAPPGHSKHNFGEAADLSYKGKSLKYAPPEVQDWVHQHAAEYGLNFPLLRKGHVYEPWHVETAEARGGKAPEQLAGLAPNGGGANPAAGVGDYPPPPPTLRYPDVPPPPQFSAPPQQALPPRPDYSRVEQEYNAAQPRPAVSQQEMKNAQLMNWLGGLAQGLNVDVSGPGGVARLLAGMAAGGGRAMSENAQNAIRAKQAEAEALRQWHLQRGELYGQEVAGQNAWEQNASSIGYRNAASDWENRNKILANQYEWQTSKAANEFNAQRETAKEQYGYATDMWKYRKAEEAANRPKFTVESGNVIQLNPDGTFKATPLPQPMDPAKQLDAANKAAELEKNTLGKDVPLMTRDQHVMDYIHEIQKTDEARANVLTHQAALQSAVESGLGPIIFGDAWKAAEKQVDESLGLQFGTATTSALAEKQRKMMAAMANVDPMVWLPIAADHGILPALELMRGAKPIGR